MKQFVCKLLSGVFVFGMMGASVVQAHNPGESQEVLIDRTKHREAKVRSDAATILHEYRNDIVYVRLIELTKDSDWRVRYAAVQSLGRWADGRAKDQILPLVGDPMPYVRMISVWALAQIGDKDSIPKIIEATNDPNREVRNCAQLAMLNLSQTGEPRDASGWKSWWEKNQGK